MQIGPPERVIGEGQHRRNRDRQDQDRRHQDQRGGDENGARAGLQVLRARGAAGGGPRVRIASDMARHLGQGRHRHRLARDIEAGDPRGIGLQLQQVPRPQSRARRGR